MNNVLKETDHELMMDYSSFPSLLQETLAGLTDSELDLCRAPGKWSIRQIIHHIVDCEMNYFQYDRYALSNTDSNFPFPAFNADTWAENMAYGSRPIELELRFFSLIREYITHLCHSLPDALDRTLKHEDGEFTVRQALEHDIAHARHHRNQIIETRIINGV
ncbi:DinB family protein [Paenibacillus solisilvae]|uniref:DinB family protein n=1 Tax=Paenibacillus solisilvae TaxID=2486751 RepID=A0ABW0VZ09_9BACL